MKYLASGERGRVQDSSNLRITLIAALFALGCAGTESASNTTESASGAADDTTTIRAALNLSGATWVAQGPAPMIHGQAATVTPDNPVTGAVHAVAPHPTNANIVYAGTVNGGVWRTDNALALAPTWRPLTDFLPSLNIGAIALDRNNSNVVIAGTGRWSSDANEGGSQGEVLISRDAGANWTVIADPLFAGQKLSGVVIRGNVVLAAAIDFVGLVRSTNGGTTWTRISDAPGSGLPCCAIDDLIEDRQNPNRLYVTMSRVGVFRSDNLGQTWVNVSQNDPNVGGLDDQIRNISNAARMSTSNDGRAYIAIESGEQTDGTVSLVEYTTDGGAHWTAMEAPGVIARGNPFFHFAIGADPTSSNFVYIEGVVPWMRGDANLNESQWTSLTFTSSPHVDDRDIGFNANGDLIDVSDGGVFRRASPRVDTGDWFSMAGNLQDGEIHHMAYDQNSRIIFGGTQDNGTIFQTAPGALSWDLAQGGDGGDVAVDVLTNPGFSIRYISSQGLGGFNRQTYNANNVLVSTTFIALAGGAIQPQFYTPIELNRVNPLRIALAGNDAVYESFNQGDTITSIGGGPFGRAMYYGHPLNADVLWLAGDGAIFRRFSGTGPLVATPTPFPSFDDRDVVADPADFRRAYVAAGFDGVFLTPDGGSNWTNITGNLITTFNPGAVRTIEFIPSSPQSAVVVGTNRGVFATTTNALGTWQEIGRLPHAPVFDMEYNRRDDLLVVGMLGRGSFTVQGLGGANQPPVARCRDVAVDAAPSSCRAAVTAADVNAGTTDPNNDPFTCVLIPAGPFAVGTTSVTLSCTDSGGATSTCSATVAVGPGNSPACCPAGTNVIVGSSNDNVLTGTAGRDCIIGLGGQDTINGLGGDDIISGGDGNDTLSGGSGNDLIFGGTGQDQLRGDVGNDVVAGGEGDDRCFGGDGDDRLFGGNGQDQLSGDAGNDRLFGNDGDDNLSGGDGDDLLDGGGLHDTCVGGAGTDTFFMCQTQTQ